jgi:hypothetical protein
MTEKCDKCGADATECVTGQTLTVEHPARYLVYLCPAHLTAEYEARLRQKEWVVRKMERMERIERGR